jgi:hypothetical protein
MEKISTRARVEIFIPVYVTRDGIFSPVNRDEIYHVIANNFSPD